MVAMACETESCWKPFTSPMKSSFLRAGVCANSEPHRPSVNHNSAGMRRFFIGRFPKGNVLTGWGVDASGVLWRRERGNRYEVQETRTPIFKSAETLPD